jgi:hypothetical protein
VIYTKTKEPLWHKITYAGEVLFSETLQVRPIRWSAPPFRGKSVRYVKKTGCMLKRKEKRKDNKHKNNITYRLSAF